jgi:hypothetical protein
VFIIKSIIKSLKLAYLIEMQPVKSAHPVEGDGSGLIKKIIRIQNSIMETETNQVDKLIVFSIKKGNSRRSPLPWPIP